MKTITINASAREATGTKNAKRLRKKNEVPCVIYGNGENINFSADIRQFSKLVYSPDIFKTVVSVNGKSYDTIMKDIQFHPVTDRISHIDFVQVSDDKPVTVDLPVKVNGNAVGVREGGRLIQNMRGVRVKGLVSAIPDHIDINVDHLAIGQSVKVSELSQEGLTFMDLPHSVVASVRVIRAVVETPAAEAKPAEEGTAPAEGEQSEAEKKPAEE